MAVLAFATLLQADDAAVPVFRSDVEMVNVSFAVTDAAGRYVRDLRPNDIRILEDGVEQQLASFTGLQPAHDRNAEQAASENSVFVLLSSSNAMYEDFMHASDTVAAGTQWPCIRLAVTCTARHR
jgi:hypothetical protein